MTDSDELGARRCGAPRRQARREERDVVLKGGFRIRVVRICLEEGIPLPAKPQLDALTPRVADVGEEYGGGARRGYRENVIRDIGAEQAQLAGEPRGRLGPKADLVVGCLHGFERRIRGAPRLKARTGGRRARARQLEKCRSAESLRVGKIEFIVFGEIVVEADAG